MPAAVGCPLNPLTKGRENKFFTLLKERKCSTATGEESRYIKV